MLKSHRSCNKAIVVIHGRAHIHDCMYIYIYIYIYDKMQNGIVQVKSSKNEEDERRFRGSKIFSRGYFEGQEFFFVGTLWVQKCFS